jgi:hypothetical protein
MSNGTHYNAAKMDYDGPSKVVHKSEPGERSAYIARVQNPRQKIAKGKGPSRRDDSLLKHIYDSREANAFDPVALKADVGAISRLASIEFIAYNANTDVFILTNAGAGYVERRLSHPGVGRGVILTKPAEEEFDARVKALSETERAQIVQQRVGQDVFKKSLLSFWSGKCCISGLAQPELLRASHAKNWSKCDDGHERLDVYNGLLLAAHLDAAFDAGLIAVNQNGVVQVSPKLNPDAVKALGLSKPIKISGIAPAHRPYLEWHLQHKFQHA